MSAPPGFVEPYPGWAQEDNRPEILGVLGSMLVLALLFVVARVYCRMISIGRLGFDDCIIVFSILVGFAYLALTVISTSYGFGRHVATLSEASARQAQKFLVISFMPGILLFALPKFAVVILLVKILHPGRCHMVVLWIMSVAFGLMLVGQLIVNLAQCRPVAAQWREVPGVCWGRREVIQYSMAFGSVSAAFDFYLALYPTIVMCRLVLNWRKKLALSSALGFGYCAAALAAYKVYVLSVPTLGLEDFTFEVDNVVLWTSIEGTFVVIGACIPCLYPLVKKIFGIRALGSTTGAAQQALGTIGGTPQSGQKRAKVSPRGTSGTSDTSNTLENEGRENRANENWPYERLREEVGGNGGNRRHYPDAAEEWAADAVAQLELQQRRVEREAI